MSLLEKLNNCKTIIYTTLAACALGLYQGCSSEPVGDSQQQTTPEPELTREDLIPKPKELGYIRTFFDSDPTFQTQLKLEELKKHSKQAIQLLTSHEKTEYDTFLKRNLKTIPRHQNLDDLDPENNLRERVLKDYRKTGIDFENPREGDLLGMFFIERFVEESNKKLSEKDRKRVCSYEAPLTRIPIYTQVINEGKHSDLAFKIGDVRFFFGKYPFEKRFNDLYRSAKTSGQKPIENPNLMKTMVNQAIIAGVQADAISIRGNSYHADYNSVIQNACQTEIRFLQPTLMAHINSSPFQENLRNRLKYLKKVEQPFEFYLPRFDFDPIGPLMNGMNRAAGESALEAIDKDPALYTR
jgi:hypothetical protein